MIHKFNEGKHEPQKGDRMRVVVYHEFLAYFQGFEVNPITKEVEAVFSDTKEPREDVAPGSSTGIRRIQENKLMRADKLKPPKRR